MKTLLILLLSAGVSLAADTNQVRKIGPRNLRQTTNAPVTPPAPPKPEVKIGPSYKVSLVGGPSIVITSTNTFTASQARRWLQEAARTVR